MGKRLDLSKGQILAAMKNTKSVKAASRYLGCSFSHLKKWMLFYKDEETGKTLFEIHQNQNAKGIPKYLGQKNTTSALIKDILAGVIDAAHFSSKFLKQQILDHGLLEEKCSMCGFNERRVLDYKIPLLIHFKNGNKLNWTQDNIEFLCYNCYFLNIGDVFNHNDIEKLESNSPNKRRNTENFDLELDKEYLEKLREVGLSHVKEEKPNSLEDDDPYILS